MTGALIKWGNWDIHTHTHTEKATWRDEGRHHSDAAKARKSERLPVNTRSRAEAWNTFSFSVLRRSQRWWHLGLGLLSFRLLNSKFLLFKPPSPLYILWQPNQLIHQFRNVSQHLFDNQRYFFPLWGWLLLSLSSRVNYGHINVKVSVMCYFLPTSILLLSKRVI